MAKQLRTVLRTCSVVLIFALAAGCSGGGGNGGGVSTIHPSYRGVQTQAAIDGNNAEEITLSAFSGGTIGIDPTVVTASAETTSAGSDNGIAAILAGAVRQMNLGSTSARPLAATPIHEPGPCGGELTGSIDGSIVGAFTGTMSLNEYRSCEAGTVLNGNVLLSGVQNQGTGAVQVTFTFNGLSVAEQDDSYGVSGSMTMNLNRNDPTSTHIGLDLVLTDGATGKTEYMIYKIGSAAKTGYTENRISGRYYSHDRGFVDFTTENPVRVPQGEEIPEGGSLRFSGAGGTWARLTFDGFGYYRVDSSDGGFIDKKF